MVNRIKKKCKKVANRNFKTCLIMLVKIKISGKLKMIKNEKI